MHWRREWDSNPRYSHPYSGFQDRRLRPLGHPSTAYSISESSPCRRLSGPCTIIDPLPPLSEGVTIISAPRRHSRARRPLHSMGLGCPFALRQAQDRPFDFPQDERTAVVVLRCPLQYCPFHRRVLSRPGSSAKVPRRRDLRPLPCGPLAAFKRLLRESPPKGVAGPSRVGSGAQDAVGGIPPGHRGPHSATIYPFRLVAQGPKLLSRRLRDSPLQVQLPR